MLKKCALYNQKSAPPKDSLPYRFSNLKQILKFENLFAKHCLNHHSQVYPDAASAETDLQTPSNRRRRRRDVIEYSRTAHGLNASHVRIRRDESDALGV